ncbi:MAG: divalent-cation tolerance protein CutA [Nitrospinae bacterium]|nr:divalent-cation tolerance protein CutA [Nitrospinota bacterium]
MTQHIVVFITAGSREEADKISKGLVEEKLAFCVNSVPGIKSTYFWEGKLCVDEEFLLIVKTRNSRFEELEKWVRENHSYDVPEVIALPILKGSEPYLNSIDDWVPGPS